MDLTPNLVSNSLEADLSLPKNFLVNLRERDDWSFVVQSHALIETAMTECLLEETAPELKDWITSMTTFAKRNTLEALKLLEKEETKFLGTFSRVRNFFVHDVKQINATLADYIARLKRTERGDFREACSLAFRVGEKAGLKKEDDAKVAKYIVENPKVVLWGNVVTVAMFLNARRLRAKNRKLPLNLVRLRDLMVSMNAKDLSSASAFEISAVMAAEQMRKKVPD